MIVETPSFNKLTGFYRGEVVAHSFLEGDEADGGDPDKEGKCKIWIPGVYDEEFKSNPKLLPDAEQASPLFCMSGASRETGVYFYPDVGSFVWCFFADGDQNKPVYFAGTMLNQIDNKLSESKKCKDADKVVVVDKFSIKIKRHDTPQKSISSSMPESQSVIGGKIGAAINSFMAGVKSTMKSAEDAADAEAQAQRYTEFEITCGDISIKGDSKSNNLSLTTTGKITIDGKDGVLINGKNVTASTELAAVNLSDMGQLLISGEQIGIAANRHIELQPKASSPFHGLFRMIF